VFGGFGPVVEDGFGIAYNISDKRFGAVITSYKVPLIRLHPPDSEGTN